MPPGVLCPGGTVGLLAARGMEAHLILHFDDHSKDECDVGLRVPVLADPASALETEAQARGPISLTLPPTPDVPHQVPQVPAPSLSTGRAVLSLVLLPPFTSPTERSGASSTALSALSGTHVPGSSSLLLPLSLCIRKLYEYGRAYA